MSGSQRKELNKNNFIVFQKNENYYVASVENNVVMLTPYMKTTMDKSTKELLRKRSVPKMNRPFISINMRILDSFNIFSV